MLIVIPTYKRIDSLHWVLLSLLQADVPNIEEDLTICLVNNYPPFRQKIEALVSEIIAQHKHSQVWQWKFIHRDKTIPAIENWYSDISKIAKEGEVIFLHGDDDLFMPYGVSSRYEAIVSKSADMLLSQTDHGLVFMPDGNSIAFKNRNEMRLQLKTKHEVGEIEWQDINSWGSAFIGNHCYRNTKNFREALDLCFKWCDELDWLDWNTRTLMLPYYLPFALKFVCGNLVGLNQNCVIRGISLTEWLNAPFGVPGWNSGFLALTSYLVLSNKDLAANPHLESARASLAKMSSDWLLTFFLDSRLTKEKRQKTLQSAFKKGFSFSIQSLPTNVSLIRFHFLRPLMSIYHSYKIKKLSQNILAFLRTLNN